MITRDLIGRTSAAVTLDVEKGHIRRFVEAIGETDPVYVDEAAALAAGHPRIPAPPTFAIALRPNDARSGVDIDWTKLLHGEQEFELHRPLYAGDQVTLTQRITDVYEKQGKTGIMDFMVLETVGQDPGGEVIFVLRGTVVVKR